MNTWNRQAETWCAYARRRRQDRRRMVAYLRQRATNETSKRLAERLAQSWKVKA